MGCMLHTIDILVCKVLLPFLNIFYYVHITNFVDSSSTVTAMAKINSASTLSYPDLEIPGCESELPHSLLDRNAFEIGHPIPSSRLTPQVPAVTK